MKKFLVVVVPVLVLMALSVTAFAENYEAVTNLEKDLLKQGWEVERWNQVPVEGDIRPVYFLDGSVSVKQIYKRWVRFTKETSSRKDLGGEWYTSEVNKQIKDVVLYLVLDKVQVTKYEDAFKPVDLGTEKKQVDSPIAKEVNHK